jgi:hypothetical protein
MAGDKRNHHCLLSSRSCVGIVEVAVITLPILRSPRPLHPNSDRDNPGGSQNQNHTVQHEWAPVRSIYTFRRILGLRQWGWVYVAISAPDRPCDRVIIRRWATFRCPLHTSLLRDRLVASATGHRIWATTARVAQRREPGHSN